MTIKDSKEKEISNDQHLNEGEFLNAAKLEQWQPQSAVDTTPPGPSRPPTGIRPKSIKTAQRTASVINNDHNANVG